MRIDIIGLGESAYDFKDYDFTSVTYGVNDVYKIFPVNYLVCIDPIRNFTPERLEVINNSKPRKFYTHLDEWDRPDKELIKLRTDIHKNINTDLIPISNSSPFVAAGLSYIKHTPTSIVLWGVDYLSHEKLKPKFDRIRKDWYELRIELVKKGCQLYLGKNYGLLKDFIPILPK